MTRLVLEQFRLNQEASHEASFHAALQAQRRELAAWYTQEAALAAQGKRPPKGAGSHTALPWDVRKQAKDASVRWQAIQQRDQRLHTPQGRAGRKYRRDFLFGPNTWLPDPSPH